jgi:hypothetical protein
MHITRDVTLTAHHAHDSHEVPLSLHIMQITRDAILTAHHAHHMRDPHIEMPLLSHTLSTAITRDTALTHTRCHSHCTSQDIPLSQLTAEHHEMPLSLIRDATHGSSWCACTSHSTGLWCTNRSQGEVCTRACTRARKYSRNLALLVGHFAGHGQAHRACVSHRVARSPLSGQHIQQDQCLEAQRAVRARMCRCRLTCRCGSAQIRQEASQGECRCPQARETSRVQTQLASLARFFAAPQRLAVVQRSAPSPFLCTTIYCALKRSCVADTALARCVRVSAEQRLARLLRAFLHRAVQTYLL